MTNKLLLAVILVGASLLSIEGCASVQSTRLGSKVHAEGLTYFLPRKDVVLSVTIPAPPATAITVSAMPSEAIPDLSQGFSATIPRSQIAKINTSFQVNTKGLLNSDSSGATTSNLTSVLQSVAGIAGLANIYSAIKATGTSSCSPGDHSMIAQIDPQTLKWANPDPNGDIRFCDIEFSLMPPPSGAPGGIESPAAGKSAPGLFYRVALPYVVRATPAGGSASDSKDFLVM